MQHNTKQHKAVANWAADCAERVLPLFEAAKPGDSRPKAAISAARRWANGKLSMADARKAAVAAHAAARDANNATGREAARAAAHAAASAHEPTSARHAANAAIKAVIAAEGDDVAEEKWQDDNVPMPQ
ncbi:MAG: putative immunity protein [Devosia sp.]